MTQDESKSLHLLKLFPMVITCKKITTLKSFADSGRGKLYTSLSVLSLDWKQENTVYFISENDLQ